MTCTGSTAPTQDIQNIQIHTGRTGPTKRLGRFSADVAETAVDTWSPSREKQYAGTVHI